LHAGWRAELREPGYRFVFGDHVDLPRFDAAKLMREALKQVEKIDAVFACDDAAAAAAYQTAKAADREKDVLFVGVGGLPLQGVLAATFLHPTGGAEAVAAAVKLLRGEKTPKQIVLSTRVIE
jgi:ribose transport system substrate-binding protein